MPESPLFKSDKPTLTFSRGTDGKMDVICTSLVDGKTVVFPGGHFEVRLGPQGIEGRIVQGPPPISADQSLIDAGYG